MQLDTTESLTGLAAAAAAAVAPAVAAAVALAYPAAFDSLCSRPQAVNLGRERLGVHAVGAGPLRLAPQPCLRRPRDDSRRGLQGFAGGAVGIVPDGAPC